MDSAGCLGGGRGRGRGRDYGNELASCLGRSSNTPLMWLNC